MLDDWFGFFVPRKTPHLQVEKLSAALRTALARPEAAKGFAERGLVPAWSTPAELAARVQADQAKWEPIVKSFGFTAESCSEAGIPRAPSTRSDVKRILENAVVVKSAPQRPAPALLDQ